MAKDGNDFFSQMKKQYGENFLDYIDSRQLEFKSIQIFRQMARGKINLEENSHYFFYFSHFLVGLLR